jgi:hypothetical protein
MAKRKPKDESPAVAIVRAPVGRPRLYKSHEAFAAKADEYFEQCKNMPTLAGLCLFMGFSDKQSFSTYAEYGYEFSLTVKKTQLRIEEDRHNRLIDKSTFTPGVIFDLKNNHGWKDQQDLNVNATLHVSKEQRDAAYSAGSRADA